MHITKWRCQSEKATYNRIHTMTYGKDKTTDRVKRSMVDRG